MGDGISARTRWPAIPSRLEARLFLGALGVSLTIRLVLAALLWNLHPTGDPQSNVDLARSLLQGRGLTVDHYLYGHDLRAMFPPAYPVLLAGTGWALGFTPLSILLLNSLIDAAIAWTMVRLGAVTAQRGAALAAAVYLLWPTILLSAPVAQKEGLATLLALLIMLLFARAARDGRLGGRSALVLGVLTATLALTQPALIFLPVGLAAALIRPIGLPTLSRAAVIALAGFVAVLLPWWLRNWALFHQFVPLTTSAGFSLAVVVNGGHQPLADTVLALPEPERSARAGAIAWQAIIDRPLAYGKAVARDVVVAWAKGSFAHERLQGYPANLILPWAIINLVQLAFAAWAAWLRPNRLLLLLLGGGLLALLPNILLEFSERHRQFLLPLLFLLCGPILLRMARLRPSLNGSASGR